jgi:hypothetical protein
MATACIGDFLKNRVAEVVHSVCEQLLKMASIVENFETKVYGPVVIKFLKSDFVLGDAGQRADFVAFLRDLFTRHHSSLVLTASDIELHVILREYARPVYPMLFSDPVSLQACNLEDELSWWLSTGNPSYVTEYQAAVSAAHTGDAARAQLPVHLFRQVAGFDAGRGFVLPHIPRLVAELTHPSALRQSTRPIRRIQARPAPVAGRLVRAQGNPPGGARVHPAVEILREGTRGRELALVRVRKPPCSAPV